MGLLQTLTVTERYVVLTGLSEYSRKLQEKITHLVEQSSLSPQETVLMNAYAKDLNNLSRAVVKLLGADIDEARLGVIHLIKDGTAARLAELNVDCPEEALSSARKELGDAITLLSEVSRW